MCADSHCVSGDASVCSDTVPEGSGQSGPCGKCLEKPKAKDTFMKGFHDLIPVEKTRLSSSFGAWYDGGSSSEGGFHGNGCSHSRFVLSPTGT